MIQGTYAYAAPPVEPWSPEPSPAVPSAGVQQIDLDVALMPPYVAKMNQRLDALEAGMRDIKNMLVQVLAGLKVREACDEMLKKLAEATREP
jgi:hypothetical protein